MIGIVETEKGRFEKPAPGGTPSPAPKGTGFPPTSTGRISSRAWLDLLGEISAAGISPKAQPSILAIVTNRITRQRWLV